MREPALAEAKTRREQHLDHLVELLSIPSISTLPEHRPDISRAAAWLASEMERVGLQDIRIIPTAGNPIIFGGYSAPGANRRTIIIYGHYDVQPPGPRSAWASNPFEPEVRDGAVFARGASDNKGQFLAHLKAVETILAVAGTLPVNVKFVLDGEEEVASPNMEAFIRSERERLQADSGVVSDGAMLAFGQPSLEYGVRGVVALEVRVYGPSRDLHSGSYGGTVYNPAHALAEMIAALHDADGRVAIPGFYDSVRPVDGSERRRLAQVPYSLKNWQAETGLAIPWGEPSYSLIERMSARPTCEVNGLWSGFQDAGVRTIIPASAGAKISMRLVPDQEPQEIAQLFSDYIHQIAPDHVRVEVEEQASCWPALMPVHSREMEAARDACEAVWQRPAVLSRGGGSLPVIAAFQRELDIPFLLMPFGLDDNRHGPDEHMLLENYFRGIETAIHFYYNLGN